VKSITGAKKKAPVLFVETYSVFLAMGSLPERTSFTSDSSRPGGLALLDKYRTDRSPVEGGGRVKRGQEGPLEGDARAAPGQSRGRAAPLGTRRPKRPSQAAGRRGVGVQVPAGAWGSTPRALGWPEALGPTEQASRAMPGAPEWHAPHRGPSGMPAPADGLHTESRRRRPALSVRRSSVSPIHSRRPLLLRLLLLRDAGPGPASSRAGHRRDAVHQRHGGNAPLHGGALRHRRRRPRRGGFSTGLLAAMGGKRAVFPGSHRRDRGLQRAAKQRARGSGASGCVLRTIPITFSGASRTPSPGQAEHPLRAKANTCSRLKQ